MRRSAVLVTAPMLFVMHVYAVASTATTGLLDAGNALDAAAQATRQFTERLGVSRQSPLGADQLAAANRARIRLGPYALRSAQSPATQKPPARHPVERYLQYPTLEHWTLAQREIAAILVTSLNLARDAKSIRADFVPDRIYQELLRLLEGPESVSGRLGLLPQPATPEDRDALEAVREKYWILWDSLADANKVLGEYLRRRTTTSTR